MKGIEPSYSAWKAAALPLSYTRSIFFRFHVKPETYEPYTQLFDFAAALFYESDKQWEV